MLKNLTDNKQLNLNQPFLSVRRISPAVASGRDETKKTDYALPTPTVSHPRYKSELKSGPVSNPGAIPFLWEQSPGKPKDDSKPEIPYMQKPPIAPRLPPGRKSKDDQEYDKALESHNASKRRTGNVHHSKGSNTNWDENVKVIEGIDSLKAMKRDKGKNESEDGDEAYMDALDKLSRTESFFLNCSVSGLSGFDEPEATPSGTSLTDSETRDFMIGRFLPAAKAMASEKSIETPHYAPKKQTAVQEQPRQPKKVLNGDKGPQLRYGPSFALHYSESHDNGEDDSDDDSDDNAHMPNKVWGFLPRFCMKSSFCLLNPVPGVSARTRLPISPANSKRSGPPSTTSCSGSENESKSESEVGFLTAHGHEDKNDEKRMYHSALGYYENKAIPGFTEEGNNPKAVYLGLKKGRGESFQELLSDENDARGSNLSSSLEEKTLHVDIIHKVESPTMRSSPSEMERPSNLHDDFHDTRGYFANQVEGRNSKPKVQTSVLNPPSMVEKTKSGGGIMALVASGQAQDHCQDAVASVRPNKDVNQNPGTQTVRKEKLENTRVSQSELLAPPPLPKSPSDSWLCRTLPSLSTKSASSRSHADTGIKNQSSKTVSSDAKWETIVKTSKGHQQHLRYSEELIALTPIPEAQ